MEEVPDRSGLNPVVRQVLERAEAEREANPKPHGMYSTSRHNQRARDLVVTQEFLDFRQGRASVTGFLKAKWIHFCETMLKAGFTVWLYEAKETRSKYITVADSQARKYLVRFSDHRPNKGREVACSCDFFVGRTHLGVTTTDQAIEATMRFFGRESCPKPPQEEDKK